MQPYRHFGREKLGRDPSSQYRLEPEHRGSRFWCGPRRREGARTSAIPRVAFCIATFSFWIHETAAARRALYSDASWSTTYRVPVDAVERSAGHLVASIEAQGCDVIVMEIADGLFQAETRELMQRPSFRALTAGMARLSRDCADAFRGASATI